jgi:hypothetical protein
MAILELHVKLQSGLACAVKALCMEKIGVLDDFATRAILPAVTGCFVIPSHCN